MRRGYLLLLGAALIAACDDRRDDAGTNVASPAADPPAASAAKPKAASDAASGTGNSAASAVPDMPALSKYEGKYPFDEIEGVTFLKHPVVVAAVKRVLPADLTATVLSNATSSPIIVTGKYVSSHACEPHNCSAHHWTIDIDRQTNSARVCYKDAALGPGKSLRLYSESGVSDLPERVCPDID